MLLCSAVLSKIVTTAVRNVDITTAEIADNKSVAKHWQLYTEIRHGAQFEILFVFSTLFSLLRYFTQQRFRHLFTFT